MATIRGPLMSFHAAGTVANVLTFRTLGTVAVASRKLRRVDTPTSAQLAARQRGAWARESWASVSGKALEQWQAAALRARLPVFGLYLREFMIQQCGLGDQPMIPA